MLRTSRAFSFSSNTSTASNNVEGCTIKALIDRGHLLGIFFANSRRVGPPYGGSEWEVRKRLSKYGIKPLYWTRAKNSIERRLGKELLVYAEKTNLST